MPTRLTKIMREEILGKVLNATTLFEQRDAIYTDLKYAAALYVRSLQPPEFYKAIKWHPPEWFYGVSEIKVLDEDCRSLHETLFPMSGGRRGWIGIDPPVPAINSYKYSYLSVSASANDTKAAYEMYFAAVGQRATAWRKQYDEAKESLWAVLLSCQTTEKLLERMPELAPHVPVVARSMPLVAPSNALSKLVELGFDRTVSA